MPLLSINKLVKAKSKFDAELEKIEKDLAEYMPDEVDDGFGVFYQPSDGFVLEFYAHNIPLALVIIEINKNGKISHDYLMRHRI